MKVEVEAPDEFARSADGRFERPPRAGAGDGSRGRSTVIAAEVPMAEMLTLWDDADFADPGPGQLPHGDEALRRGAAAGGGEDSGYGEEAGGEEEE